MKLTISVDKEMLAHFDALAQEIGVSRDQLFETAMRLLLLQHENRRILDALNDVYGEDGGTQWNAEDEALAAAHRATQRRLLQDDRWD